MTPREIGQVVDRRREKEYMSRLETAYMINMSFAGERIPTYEDVYKKTRVEEREQSLEEMAENLKAFKERYR